MQKSLQFLVSDAVDVEGATVPCAATLVMSEFSTVSIENHINKTTRKALQHNNIFLSSVRAHISLMDFTRVQTYISSKLPVQKVVKSKFLNFFLSCPF